ncbi:MAG: enoyl-CoA hydratase/isomerase family protein [Maritimibacter sp.]
MNTKTPTVLLEGLESDVATLTLNRPDKMNALTDEMVQAFFAALDQLSQSTARVLIVTGAGRGFCAGFDLSLADGVAGDTRPETEAWMGRQERYAAIVTRLREVPQPTIAAVNGAAAGAGLGLALGCDMRIGSTAARFSSAFIRVGMSSCDIGVSYLLPRAIGTTHAAEMMFTGRMVEAEEAARIGLISRAVPADSLLDDAQTLASQIAANGSLNTWLTKRGLWANLEAGSLAAAIELENRTQILIRNTGSLQDMAAKRGFMK